MPLKEKDDYYCSAKIRDKRVPDEWDQDVAYCAHRAGKRTDHSGEGRCYLHGGCSRSANEGNDYATKHGLNADRQKYYDKKSAEEQEWIDSIVESILDDAPFGPDAKYKLEMVRNVAIDMHKMKNANDYIDEKGVVHRDKTVGYTDSGKPIKMDEENTINIAYDRLDRATTRKLEKLGVLDDPESQKAEAQENIANELSELRKAREQE
jgi:hypothetical protein